MENSNSHVAVHHERDALSGRLMTSSCTEVYLDEKSNSLMHGDPDTCPHNVMLVSIEGLAIFFHCPGIHEPRVLSLPFEINSRNLDPADPSVSATETSRLTVVGDILFGDSLFGLIAGNTFLCAEPNGRITLSRSACNDWELFRIKALDLFDAGLIEQGIGILDREESAEATFPFDFYREGVVDFDEKGVPVVPGGMKIAI